MASSMFNMFGNSNANPMQQLMNEARKFKEEFRGDPREEVQKLLNSGQISQEQFDQAWQIAQQVSRMMGGNV